MTSQIQVQPGFKTAPLGHDTLCFRYRFAPRDTVIYSIEAADSIAFLGDAPMLRIRAERMQIVCDSVSADQVYHLTFTLLSYRERSTTANDSAERQSHPWVGHPVYVGLDSLGHRRYAYSSPNSQTMISPGGAFQPLLLPPLDTSCGRQNQSWMYEDTLALVENGVPYPVMHVGYLWRVLDKADTLGKEYVQIQYTQSGIGQLVLEGSDAEMSLLCQSAGYGKLTFDPVVHLPYAVFATVENKLTLVMPGGREKKGEHKTMMHAFLESISKQK